MAVPVERVASMPLFAELPDSAVRRLAGWFDEREYEPGDAVVRAGAAGYSFFVLLRGTLSVMSPNRQVRKIVPGDFFGEISIIGDGHRTATITADEAATVLEMFGTHFRELQMELPEVGAMVEAAMKERIARDQS